MKIRSCRKIALILVGVLLALPQNAAAYSADSTPAGMTGSLTGGFADTSDYALLTDDLRTAQPGTDYSEREVVFYLGQDPEENMRASAERVAFSCNGRLVDYESGVGLVRLPSSAGEAKANARRYAASAYGSYADLFLLGRSYEVMTVEQAVNKSLKDPHLPVLEPNYYQRLIDDTSVFDTDMAAASSETAAYDTAASHDADIFADDDTALETASPLQADPFLNIESSMYQYHHHMIGSDAAWEAGYTGSSEIKVAVIDTGVPASHEDLPGVIQVAHNNRRIPLHPDASSHGTHVAGIIGAAMNNGKGGAGVAPGVIIVSYNVCKTTPNNMEDYDIFTALLHCVQDEVNIVNMSFGGPYYSTIQQTLINDVHDAGITMFAALGNDAGGIKNYPAACDNVISIGAVGRSGARAVYSDYGYWCDLSAPGTRIISTTVPGLRSDADKIRGYYAPMSGTSMACPVAAGAAALYMSAFGDPGPDNMYVYMSAAVMECPSNGMGEGIIDVAKLMKVDRGTFAAEDPRKRLSISIGDDPFDDDTAYVMAGAQIKLNVHYDVSPGTPIAGDKVIWAPVPEEGMMSNCDGRILTKEMVSIDGDGVLKVKKKFMNYILDKNIKTASLYVYAQVLDDSLPEIDRYVSIPVRVVGKYSKITKAKKWRTTDVSGKSIKKKTSKIKLNAVNNTAVVSFSTKSCNNVWRVDSSDPDVAGAHVSFREVNTNGKATKGEITIIRGRSRGTATITARCLDGSGRKVKWTVSNK